MKKILVGCLVAMITTSHAKAITFDFWQSLDINTKSTYISGIGEGISWAESFASDTGAEKLYCPPVSLGITGRQYLQMLEGFVEKKSADVPIQEIQKIPVGLLMIYALQDAFPCK